MAKIVKIDREAGDFALDMGNMIISASPVRCPACGRFLFYEAIAWGAIKIRCTNSKCHQWLTLDVSPQK